jgi:hypothetical protein
MMRAFLLTAGFALSWTLSPDALVLLGNAVGSGGHRFLLSLAGGLLLTASAVLLRHHRGGAAEPLPTAYTDLTTAVGRVPAMALSLASHLSLVLLLPTGMLVSAGFAFNETFAHRFPNFAFSALLLAAILAAHLAGERSALTLQWLLLLVTAGCLSLLVLIGLTTSPALPSLTATPPTPASAGLIPTGLATCLLLLLGFETSRPGAAPEGPAQLLAALAGVGVLLALWSVVSLAQVSRESLATSTLPHLLTARELLGQPGRMVMAVAIISGSCSLVNGLFLRASDALGQLPSAGRTGPGWFSGHRGRLFAVFFALAIAFALAGGLAGSDSLATFIQGSLLLWLLLTAGLGYGAGKRLCRQGQTIGYLAYPVVAAQLAAIAWLTATSPQADSLVLFCLLTLAAAGLLATVWLTSSSGTGGWGNLNQ